MGGFWQNNRGIKPRGIDGPAELGTAYLASPPRIRLQWLATSSFEGLNPDPLGGESSINYTPKASSNYLPNNFKIPQIIEKLAAPKINKWVLSFKKIKFSLEYANYLEINAPKPPSPPPVVPPPPRFFVQWGVQQGGMVIAINFWGALGPGHSFPPQLAPLQPTPSQGTSC